MSGYQEADITRRAFGDLEPGLHFETAARTVTETDIVLFACLTGDLHPQHTDAAWAARSPYGERIAHGLLLVSYAIGLLTDAGSRVAGLRGIGEVTFKAPGRLGDTIRLTGTITPLEQLDETHGVVSSRCAIVEDRGLTLARLRLDLLWLAHIPRPDGPKEGDLLDGAPTGVFPL